MNLRTVMIGLSVVALAIVVVEWMSGTADGTHDLWFTCAFLSSTIFALGGHFLPRPERARRARFAVCCEDPNIHYKPVHDRHKDIRTTHALCFSCQQEGPRVPWTGDEYAELVALAAWNVERGEQ